MRDARFRLLQRSSPLEQRGFSGVNRQAGESGRCGTPAIAERSGTAQIGHMQALSIAIAGAGPAGLPAALLLHRDGHRVTLFEQFEAPQPIGSGSDPAADRPRRARRARPCRAHSGARQPARPPVRPRAALRPDRARRSLSQRSAGGRFGLGVHRAALFNVLFDAVVACRHSDRDEPPHQRHRTRRRRSPAPCPASMAGGQGRSISSIDALGVRSPLWPLFGGRERRDLRYGALWASLPWPAIGLRPARARAALSAREHDDRRACRSAGDAKDGREEAAFFWSLRTRRFRRVARELASTRGRSRSKALWPETAPLLDAIRDAGADDARALRPSHAARGRSRERLVAIGDAFHAASPQLGQGANMAMLDARALATGASIDRATCRTRSRTTRGSAAARWPIIRR